MTYYTIANVVFAIDFGEVELEESPKIHQFITAQTYGMPNVSIEAQYVDQIREIKSELLYKDTECSYWAINNTRIYERLGIKYAKFYKTGENRYQLEIHRAYTKYVHTELHFFNLIGLEMLLVDQGGFFLHSSLINYKGKGILFSAPSGTGKSTQANLWHDCVNAKIINGDRSFINSVNDRWIAYGVPYSGSSEYCTTDSCPITAIVLLSQAPYNKVERVTGVSALKKIYSECTVNYWDDMFVNKVMDMISNLIQTVPIYHYRCTKNPEAVEVLLNVINGGDDLCQQ